MQLCNCSLLKIKCCRSTISPQPPLSLLTATPPVLSSSLVSGPKLAPIILVSIASCFFFFKLVINRSCTTKVSFTNVVSSSTDESLLYCRTDICFKTKNYPLTAIHLPLELPSENRFKEKKGPQLIAWWSLSYFHLPMPYLIHQSLPLVRPLYACCLVKIVGSLPFKRGEFSRN